MGDEKPKILWHADDKGKCHLACEQAFQNDHDFNTAEVWCQLMAKVVPTNARMHTNGDSCPFAVLADVLCSAKPHEDTVGDLDLEHMMHLAWGCGYRFGRELPNDDNSEDIDRMNSDVHSLIVHERSEVKPDSPKPDEDHRCQTCAAAETIQCGAGLIDRGPMRCWRPKPDEDRRCGTCAERHDGRCPFVRAYEKVPVLSDWMVTFDSGPPWPNCRFWRQR